MPRTRSRRRLATVAAAALAFAGLAIAPPAAEAAAQASVTVSPGSVSPGTSEVFAVTVEGGSSNNVAAMNIIVPPTLSDVSYVTHDGPTGWVTAAPVYDAANRVFALTATGNPQPKLGEDQRLTLKFRATVPSAGPLVFNVDTWSNNGRNGKPTEVSPAYVTVGSLAQSITFGELPDRTWGDSDFTVAATGGASGNPVTFAAEGQCTATGTDGSTISLTGAGTCSVTAAQAGGNGYAAADPVTRTFTINKADQAISFDPIETQTYGDGPLDLVASSDSGLSVSFSSTGTCSVNGTSLSLDGAGDCTVTATQSGNDNFNAAEPVERTFTINKADAVLSLGDLGPFTYDGSAHHAVVSTEPTGLDGVTITYSRDGEPVDDPTAAGSYDVTATLDNGNYTAEQVTGTLVIEQARVTGSFTVSDRDYDGGTSATITGCSLSEGVVDGDEVELDCSAATATFDSRNAGSRTATISGAVLTGGDAANYVLGEVETASATISPRTVTGAITAGDKNYDGSTTAQATGLPLEGVVGSDDVSVELVSAEFDTKDVGEDKTVTATIKLAGADAANYQLSSTTATATANIWARLLVGSFTADDKVYDGNTTATVHPVDPLENVVGDEQVSLQVTNATFADKNVGEDKLVTATLSLVGPDAGNYALNPNGTSDTALADITVRTVDGSFTAANKVYDGNTDASITGRSLAAASGDTGKVAGDDVQLSGGTASFAEKNVGTWTVTGSGFGLTGDDAANYVLGTVADTTAEITAKELTGSFTAEDKVYDGNTDATITGRHLDGVVGEDDVELSGGTAEFADKNVGTDKEVTGTGFALAGDGAGNYTLASSTLVTTADITAKELTGSFAAADKVYDGTRDARITARHLDGVVEGDDVVMSDGTASFAEKNVGTWTVTGSGFGLTGEDAANYVLGTVADTTAEITAKELTGSFTAEDKVYDGNTDATITDRSLDGVVGEDDVKLSGGTAEFADKNVGTDKEVTGTGFALAGDGAGNYTLASSTLVTIADITAKELTGSFAAADKVWEGTTDATISGRYLDGVVEGDEVTLTGGHATFDNANVGSGKKVTGEGFTLAGGDAGNYVLDEQPWFTTAAITPLYSGTGFYKPVDMPNGDPKVWNTIKGGQTVPLKFEIFNANTGVEQTSLSVFGPDAAAQAAAFRIRSVACESGYSLTEAVEFTTTGGTSLRYDATAGQFIQNWKTPTGAGNCYAVSVQTVDGTTVGPAYFEIKK